MNVEELRAACDAVLADPALRPSAGKTHCNEAARRVANAMGFFAFNDPALCADDMVNLLRAGGVWTPADGPTAAAHALDGGLAFAGLLGAQLHEEHGHLAPLYPIAMQFSGSLGRRVPMLANVGRTVGLEKVSEAFPVKLGEPDYFIF